MKKQYARSSGDTLGTFWGYFENRQNRVAGGQHLVDSCDLASQKAFAVFGRIGSLLLFGLTQPSCRRRDVNYPIDKLADYGNFEYYVLSLFCIA